MGIDLSRLKDKFRPDEIEWRAQNSGRNEKTKKAWAMVLAYVDNRAIQDRLDDVCGPANWSNHFVAGPDGGVICQISIQVREGIWVTKEDGAENTDIEPVKGGLSGSMKRAASQWGIGRYLYDLESAFVEVKDRGRYRIADKKNQVYGFWDPPALPKWALPRGAKPVPTPKEQASQTIDAPAPEEETPRENAVGKRRPSRPDSSTDTNPQRTALKRALLAAMKQAEPCDEKGLPVWTAVATTIQTLPGLPEFNPLSPSMDGWNEDQLKQLLSYYNLLIEEES